MYLSVKRIRVHELRKPDEAPQDQTKRLSSLLLPTQPPATLGVGSRRGEASPPGTRSVEATVAVRGRSGDDAGPTQPGRIKLSVLG